MLTIDLPTARRFILGKQGLWPGRRWRGLDGAAQAMREMEYLQLDPLQIIARSHDIALHSRVLDYTPGMWETPTYQQRSFFDWGGWLAVRPMDELPYWRVLMRRERDGSPNLDTRIHRMAIEHADAVTEMRALLREVETVSNRDFEMATRTRTQSYRGRKDSALALYYLWRIGEVMTHHRRNFERVYALAKRVAPGELLHDSDDDVAERYLVLKEISFYGLMRQRPSYDTIFRGMAKGAATPIVARLLAEGELVAVHVEGWKEPHLALGIDAALLDELGAGRTPAAWKPLESTTVEEAVFLAPLDHVSARGRAKKLFDFDYVWEVYKPEHLRRYGYYALPVLWGDQLIARFDSKLDRTTNTFVILGLWLEHPALANDEAFAQAFTRGLARFVTFLGADAVDVTAIQEPLLRSSASSAAKQR